MPRKLRWPDGPMCVRCNSKATKIANRFNTIVTHAITSSASPLEQSSTTRTCPFEVVSCRLSDVRSKKGISALQLKRTIKVAYKTAWYLCHRIRAAMQEVNPEPLKGIVEVDETYIGGKRRHVGSGYVGNKTMVLGAIQRGGHVHLHVERRVKKATKKELHEFVRLRLQTKRKES